MRCELRAIIMNLCSLSSFFAPLSLACFISRITLCDPSLKERQGTTPSEVLSSELYHRIVCFHCRAHNTTHPSPNGQSPMNPMRSRYGTRSTLSGTPLPRKRGYHLFLSRGSAVRTFPRCRVHSKRYPWKWNSLAFISSTLGMMMSVP